MTVDHATLTAWLTRLKLTAIRDQLDSLLDEAARRDLSLREALAFLVEREVARKDERRVEMAVQIARFPYQRDLDGFDFAAQPSVDSRQLRELAACRWVAHGKALLLLGPPGVGKTHLAIALGRAAIREGYSVLFATAPTLVAALAKAHVEGRLEERLGFYAKPELLIIDELGYLPFEPNAAHLSFQLVSHRYERRSLLLTSNGSVGEWGTVFGDPVVPTAILDRLLHHSHVITSTATATGGARSAAPASSRSRRSTVAARIRRACPGRWVHRSLPRSAPLAARSALRSARVPPTDYLDKPARPPLARNHINRWTNSSCREEAGSGCRLTPDEKCVSGLKLLRWTHNEASTTVRPIAKHGVRQDKADGATAPVDG